MAATAKIAISVERELLERLERLRLQTGESRSAAVARALRLLTGADENARRVAEYVQAYKDVPETEADAALARRLAKSALRHLPWDEE